MIYRNMVINFHEIESYIITFLDIKGIGNYMLVDKHCHLIVKKVLSFCLQNRNEFVSRVLDFVPTPQWVVDHAKEIKTRKKDKKQKGWFDENFSIWSNLEISQKIYNGCLDCYCCGRILFHDGVEKTYVHNPYQLDHNCYVKKYYLYCRICFIASIALCYKKRGRFYKSRDIGYKLQNEFYTIKRKECKQVTNEIFNVDGLLKIAYKLENDEMQDEPFVQAVIKFINTRTGYSYTI